MNRKFVDRCNISVNVERSLYTKYNNLLPRGIFFSDELDEFLRQRVIDLEKDRNTADSNKGPIRIYENANGSNTSLLKRTTDVKLDICASNNDLIKYVENIPDSKTAYQLARKASLLRDLANTKAKKLQKEDK